MLPLQSITRFRQQFIEQRRSIRERVQFSAWIDIGDGSPQRNCTVVDVSDNGAKITLSSTDEMPEEFWLVLTKDGHRSRCRTVWRSDNQIGVNYLRSAAVPQLPPVST